MILSIGFLKHRIAEGVAISRQSSAKLCVLNFLLIDNNR